MSRAHWILGLAGAGVAAGVVAWGLGAFEPEAVELEVRPNVLIIVWDTVRVTFAAKHPCKPAPPASSVRKMRLAALYAAAAPG